MPNITFVNAGTRKRYTDDAVDPATGEPSYLEAWRAWRAGVDGAAEPDHVELEVVTVVVDEQPIATVPRVELDAYLATYYPEG